MDFTWKLLCLPPQTHPTTAKTQCQQVLTRFWPNFKGRLLGTSRTDSKYHVYICPGDICPYQEYLSCYWPDFDENLKVASWEHWEQFPTAMLRFVQATFALVTFVHISNMSAVTGPILTTLFGPNFFGVIFFFSKHNILLGPKDFRPEILLDSKKNLNSNFLRTPNIC